MLEEGTSVSVYPGLLDLLATLLEDALLGASEGGIEGLVNLLLLA